MRPRVPVFALACLSLLLARAGAEERDPRLLVGMDLKSAMDSLGLPQSMFSFRGSEEARDDVVFYYSDHLYLFWYRDRVWQVRFDRRYAAPVLGYSLGMARDQVLQGSTRALRALGDSLYFDMDSGAVPMRVRLAFSGGVLSDLYVYRSDF
jgi:hypothetical protein